MTPENVLAVIMIAFIVWGISEGAAFVIGPRRRR